jgi:hypothetical protein
MNEGEAFAILDDVTMRGDGARFTLDGVAYVGQWVNGGLIFRRA